MWRKHDIKILKFGDEGGENFFLQIKYLRNET
jgi:hypothetical protein